MLALSAQYVAKKLVAFSLILRVLAAKELFCSLHYFVAEIEFICYKVNFLDDTVDDLAVL